MDWLQEVRFKNRLQQNAGDAQGACNQVVRYKATAGLSRSETAPFRYCFFAIKANKATNVNAKIEN
jgi:hypothetical protein